MKRVSLAVSFAALAASLFGCDLVCGFTGRIIDKPIPDLLPAFAKFFGPVEIGI